MIRNLFPCLLAIPLLVACDKQRDSGHRGDAPGEIKTKSSRPDRPSRALPDESPADLRESLKRAREIDAPDEREKALALVAWDAIGIDAELAGEAFAALSADSSERIRLVQHFAMVLAEENPDGAMKWAAELGSEKETAAAMGRIALVVSDTDPERAANLLSESGIEGRDFDVAVVQVLQRWAAKAPPEAAAWVVMFPAGQAREAGIKTIVSQWAEADAPAAFAWMATLQDEAIRKETSLAMAEALLQQPEDVRDAWLKHADAGTRGEIEKQRDNAMKEVGDNVPPPSR